MPRLPDKEALGQQSFGDRPLATISATPAPDGVMLGAVGDGLAKFGDTMTAVELEAKKKDDALDLIRAEAYHKGVLRDTEDELRRDPDHRTYKDRYLGAATKSIDEAANGIRDPRARAMWKAKASAETEQGLARVNNYGFHRAAQEKEVEIENTLKGYENQYARRDIDDEERRNILRDMDQTVKLGEASGLVMPTHAQRLREKHIEGTIAYELERQVMSGGARDVLKKLGGLEQAAPGSARAAQEEPGLAPGPRKYDLTGVLTSGTAKDKPAGWAASNPRWQELDPFEKAAAMSLMEADGADTKAARNALGAMINRAAKNGEDLGAHVSQKIYQPTIEQAQEKRLETILKSPKFSEMVDWAKRRAAGEEADPVNGATHFLAHEPTMEKLRAQEPGKYRSWSGWSGYDAGKGRYTNPDGSEVIRDKSHAFLAPEGRWNPDGKPQRGKIGSGDSAVEYSDLPAMEEDGHFSRLSVKKRHAIVHMARNALRNDVKRELEDELQQIYDTGAAPKDKDGLTALDRASGILDPNQLSKARAQFDVAHEVHRATASVRDMSPDEAEEHMRAFDPSQNAPLVDRLGYAGVKRVYDAGQKEWERAQEMRKKDPAFAADQGREVQSVITRAQRLNPEISIGTDDKGNVTVRDGQGKEMDSLEFSRELIRARLEAQERYGIPEDRRRVITKQEAEGLLPSRSWKDMRSNEFRETIKAAADKAEKRYGRQYAQQALETAIGYAIKDTEHNQIAARIVVGLSEGNVSADDMRKYDGLRQIKTFNDYMGQSEGAEAMRGASAGRSVSRTGDPARPAIDPSQAFNFGSVSADYLADQAKQSPSVPERKPSADEVAWLKRNPGRWQEFDAQFGRFSAAKVLGNVR